MPLTHVCIWDASIGFRRITIEEACGLFPYRVSARSGQFVCELCAQNICLTASGKNDRHFRHDSSTVHKECDDRQAYFDPSYGRSIRSLNSHLMPLRLLKTGSGLRLQLGFFYPPDEKAQCDRIKISTDSQEFEYSFSRIEREGVTYLDVGSVPSKTYSIKYINANAELTKFWSEKVQGIDAKGAFFDYKSGKILPLGGKAYTSSTYYLLSRYNLPMYLIPQDIELNEILQIREKSSSTWYLYKIRVRSFSEHSAKFFLKYSVFLTEKPTRYYPIWPTYVKDPYFIYHNSVELYYYLCGDDAELKSYPISYQMHNTNDGRLYRLASRSREQLISLGKSGSLGFSYLIRQPINKQAVLPSVVVTDLTENLLEHEEYSKIPKLNTILVTARFDGKAVFKLRGKTRYIYKINGNQLLQIDGITFGTEILFYQGCDCVRKILFEKEIAREKSFSDKTLLNKLKACSGQPVKISHAIGTLAKELDNFPLTKQWLYNAIKTGSIPRSAFLLLQNATKTNR